MATGVVSDGQVFGTFGSVTAHTSAAQVAAWHPAIRSIQLPKYRQPYNAALLRVVEQQLPRLDAPYSSAKTCGAAGQPCRTGNSVAALAGLGDVSNFLCSDWAKVMTQMQVALAKAEAQGSSSVDYFAAKSYFDANTGPFQKPIFSCASQTSIATRLYNALVAEVGGAATSDIFRSSGEDGDKILTGVKWGAIALGAVAVAYTLGPLLRSVGSLIGKAGK